MNVINNMKESESEVKKVEYGKGKVKLVCWKVKVAVILEREKRNYQIKEGCKMCRGPPSH